MRNTIYLNDGWKLCWRSFRDEKDIDKLTTGSTDDWISATVPGDVHIDLLKNGIGPDFYYGLNADLWRWVEEKDWWYRTEINTPNIQHNEVVHIIFEGVDTFSTIFINGEKIITNKNMFTPIEIDITQYCKKYQNIKIAVKISSPIFSVDVNKDQKIVGSNLPRMFARKAQYNYGWDIAPRLISIGIWRPVRIETYNCGRIKDFWITIKKLDKKKSILECECEIEYFKQIENGEVKIEIFEGAIDEQGNKIIETSKKISSKNFPLKISINLKNPKIWWPNGFGEQNLYSYIVSLKKDGKIIDEKRGNFGIKKIELIQEKLSKSERSFYFKINNKKIFIKGLNWTPLDALPGSIENEKYEKVIKLVKNINANMLRVWGGGIYEPDIFYDLCDKYGIMIWQDFMFACGRYPENKEFLNEVKDEATYVIKRLRKHVCISLWCGGNENDIFRYWEDGHNYIKHKCRNVLKKIWEKLNTQIPFIPDSPFSPSENDPNDDKEGDVHLWAHGKSYKDNFYIKKRPKFVSEIGHISVPDKKTLLSFIPDEKLWPVFNEYWYYHSSDTLRVGWKYRINSLFNSIKANNLPQPENI
ncbi:MAG TPA: glycoside hydrolase family 2 TIM barrel-domain containing protein, partial [Candidatus Ratteibacteria bacterium]|nr:glycoside hydrolase family 2 TIM barrel-domain containing protein [Candidatus Ratteibacteria bacterium]